MYLETPGGLRLLPTDRADLTDTGWQWLRWGSVVRPASNSSSLAWRTVVAHRTCLSVPVSSSQPAARALASLRVLMAQ
ncbi:hypothetical protein [Nocardia sp. NPDC004860]|uniref:hypothetical protein n=1 Tax=Nocardia sp. NPDC004860 TaxID=3154557 RepID=UPI0033A8F581